MKIVCATGNVHKVEEFQQLLSTDGGLDVEVLTAKALGGMPEVDENADSFKGNAGLKAKALQAAAKEQGIWVLADDSGLMVDALDGAPGVYSARYAGPDATDEQNVEKLIKALHDVPLEKRAGRFVCALVLISPDDEEMVVEDYCHGHIAEGPKGENGFGYDPVFIPEGYTQTFGELGAAVKDQLSHRARAVEALLSELHG